MENGVSVQIMQTQTPLVLFTIKGILGFVSIIMLFPSTLTALRWRLTREKHAKLIGYLDKKRAGLIIEAGEEAEVKQICDPLI